jgi:hypothetical protein
MTIQWLFLPGLASRLKCEKIADDNEKRQRTVAHKLMDYSSSQVRRAKNKFVTFCDLTYMYHPLCPGSKQSSPCPCT